MSERKAKRRWFRFHLSTLIVIMFSAGGIVFLNVGVRYQGAIRETNALTYGQAKGFPFPVMVTGDRVFWASPREKLLGQGGHGSSFAVIWSKANLFLNVLVALVTLALIAFLCERFIRRRQRKQQAPQT